MLIFSARLTSTQQGISKPGFCLEKGKEKAEVEQIECLTLSAARQSLRAFGKFKGSGGRL